ncbi:MAG: PD-(D/E)XK nuclease family protein [Gammaproteobacteria bacterium]|nr:PD-(D/E)XK nuclease family protein [Gammaproteobacteria bacterium]
MVPSRQRAAALRLATVAQAQRRALRVWRTPDVLPWQGWLTREFQERRHELSGPARLMRPTEAWFHWRGIAGRLADAHGLLSAGGLAVSLPRTLARLRDWGLSWSDAGAGLEAELLRAAARDWHRICREQGAVDASDWQALPGSPASTATLPVILAGFASMGSARRSWLASRGIALAEPPSGALAPMLTCSAADPADELRAAAAWCRSRLTADPRARLLVLIPDLERQRARLQRIFGEVLAPEATGIGPAVFGIEGGQPLAQFPLVRIALAWLALDVRPLAFADFSALLRTPYLALGTPEACTRLELWLRDRGLGEVDRATLRRLAPAVARDLGGGADEVVLRLVADAAYTAAADGAPGGWIHRYAARLRAAGWPGTRSLGSEELQVRRRFDELLGEVAACGSEIAPRAGGPALQLLEALTRETAFEPATDDLPVTLSAHVEDPLVGYDGIWVCGCDAARLPAPPAPDAFIPLSLQLRAGAPEASAEGQLALARAALLAWRAATPQLILSWARADEDAEQDPSSLLAHGMPWGGPPTAAAVVVAAPLEPVADERAPPWPKTRRMGGGVQALQWQAECPFRAFAQLRLGASPIAEPAVGVEPRLRGRVLHRALETLWRELGDSAALQSLAPEAQLRRVDAAVDTALEIELRESLVPLPALLRAAERRRGTLILGALLDVERARAAFRVLATEVQRPLELRGMRLGVRLDRVDVLEDGGIAIIDYKTGRPESFDPQAERPQRPQLPGYALAWGEGVVALACVHLRREGVKWRGTVDTPGRLPQLRAAVANADEWSALQARWRTSLGSLVDELAGGCAGVTPLPGVCEHCHLAPLCRIDAVPLAVAQSDAEDGDEGG